MDKIKEAAHIRPSDVQLRLQRLEFYAFIHFGMNTFTEMEWGTGQANPELFNPTDLDTDQWVKAIKAAGMKAIILTTKHHDGFCLWPSAYTDYSVKSSSWQDGKGDVVKALSDSCKKYGIGFGVYLSPWDRHESTYGTEAYNTYFIHQLTELLTGYGELFTVWFDGACGEGKNGKRQVYDWEAYYKTIRKLQPHAAISIMGPDIRWCGNEAGRCRPSEWSVVPIELRDQRYIAGNSQQDDIGTLFSLEETDTDLGSRDKIQQAKELIWYPSEVDSSIRPKWFYHTGDDDKVRSLDNLIYLYCSAVGGNNTLLLNLPPNKEGRLTSNR